MASPNKSSNKVSKNTRRSQRSSNSSGAQGPTEAREHGRAPHGSSSGARHMRLLLEQKSSKYIIDYEDRFSDANDLFINKLMLDKTVLHGSSNINKPMHPFIEHIKYRIRETYQNTYFADHLCQIEYTGNANETIEQIKKIMYLNKQVRETFNPEIQLIGTDEVAFQLATAASVRLDLVGANMS